MILTLGRNTTVKGVKLQFRSIFPYLKIEFANKPHLPGEFVQHSAKWYADDCKISSIARSLQPEYIYIQPWHNTGEVEALFHHQFGLNAQIFRREGDEWLQTAGTDVLTLTEQNETGRLLSLRKSGISRKECESLF